MPTIRDTIDPTREREVSDVEALDLERQGVVLTGTRAKTDEGLRAAAVRQVMRAGDEDVDAASPAEQTATPTDPGPGPEPGPNPDDTGPDAGQTTAARTSTQES